MKDFKIGQMEMKLVQEYLVSLVRKVVIRLALYTF